METVNWEEMNLADRMSGSTQELRAREAQVGPVSIGPQGVAIGYPTTPSRSDSIFTRPVLVGAGVGFLARGVTGAIVGAILGSFWKR